jgi:nitrous oxidase accessory protein
VKAVHGWLCVILLMLSPAVSTAKALTPLQPLIDATDEGAVLLLEPGTYAGPVRIDRAMTLDGQGKATIDAGGKGSVIVVDTDGAIVRNLHLTHSGESHNDIDAGVQVRGNFNVISDNVIDDCLFGVDLQQSDSNIVRRNRISSKPFELGTRGDAIRLWYSFHNKVTDNTISDSRDTVVWYSANNTISRNTTFDSRYSLHFMYSRYNLVEDNRYYNNTVGVFLMYSDGVVLRNNYIAHASGATGVGIGFKETSDVTVEGNKILYCASGLYVDVSPFQPDTINKFSDNLIAYNGIGVRFLNDWKGNEFRENRFIDNLTQVVVSSGKTANRNLWEGNYWSDYEGFDKDGDGVGDTAYELYVYADRLWQDVPFAQFFKGSPVLEVLDFLERLAPFTEPHLLVSDARPSRQREITPVKAKQQVRDSLDLLRQSLGR